VAPPIKPPTHSSQAAALWTWQRQPSRKKNKEQILQEITENFME
jgi:hypothetical protein